jgi:HSP20 family protein
LAAIEVDNMNRNKREEVRIVPTVFRSPFAMLDDLDRMFNHSGVGFEGLWVPSIAIGRIRVPMVDLKDEGDHYVVEAEIPGIERENVEIELGDDSIEISAKKDEQREERGEGYIRKERGTFSFYRRLPLPENVSKKEVEARLTDGILKILIPKAEKPKEEKKKVEIK